VNACRVCVFVMYFECENLFESIESLKVLQVCQCI